MSYNFIREAVSIDNSPLCRYDTSDGYSSDFHINGNVDGWDVYYNTYMYGCWTGVLFGTAFNRAPYISRSVSFSSIEAEYYYYVRIMMKITNNNTNKLVGGLTKGKVMWTTSVDSSWNDNKSIEFDIIADDQWHLYNVNVGPSAYWVGYINNLRVYPFLDGWSGDQFAVKYIRIGSLDYWGCSNTQCSYYTQYQHPCSGAGVRGSCEAGISKLLYTTTSEIDDELILDIDGYGECAFKLGTNINIKGYEIARIIGNKISSLNIGGYAFSTTSYTENDTIKITSGTTGTTSAVIVTGTAAEALGFYLKGDDVSIKTNGTTPATGFDYSASRLLTAAEINKLIDGNVTTPSYFHKPDQYNVEAGRGDFNEISAANLTSEVTDTEYVRKLENRGSTLIDHSHPINNNGRLKTVYVSGINYGKGKIKICRPHSDGTFTVIASINFSSIGSGMYTTLPTNYRIDCDVLVNKGDRIGIYGCDIHVGKTLNGYPDATYSQYNGEAAGRFDPGDIYSFGVAGFAIYARGDRWQTNVLLDIDLGGRTNIEEFNVHGKELTSYFEYNILSCLDVTWDVDVFGETHKHLVQWILDGSYSIYTHNNYARGNACLDDMVITPDNGAAGSSLESSSGPHSYFYVTGDAEWLQGECDGTAEFCYPRSAEETFDYKYDKVKFTALFPHGLSAEIHKSVMYFKERNNFRSFWLSTFLGNYDSTGNDPLDLTWRLIPEFKAISLDGIRYDETNNELFKPYLFKNPVSQRNMILAEERMAANYADWYILAHEFDPIMCKGFRIVCDEHYSTKITELEVYGRLKVDPSLVDNVLLSFSDYGDVWKTVQFLPVGENSISGFIGGSPRYFRIELESSTKYNINELEMLVGDQFQMDTCEDEGVLLETSKTNSSNPSTSIAFTNIYDKPFDLLVDLPRESYQSSGLLFWSKLGSQAEIEVPELGPKCILHKAADYPLVHDNSQCAVDVPCYGLKNLVQGKQAYKYLYDAGWYSAGTLSSGVSVEFNNYSRFYYKKSEFSFIPASVQYYKLEFNKAVSLRDIYAFYEGAEETIEKVYWGGLTGTSNPILEFNSNHDIDTSTSTIRTYFNDNFTGANNSVPNTNKWSRTNANTYIYNNNARMAVSSSVTSTGLVSLVPLTGDFDVEVDWNIVSQGSGLGWWWHFQMEAVNSTWTIRWTRSYNTTGNTRSYLETRDGNGVWDTVYVSTGAPSSGTFEIIRSGRNITFADTYTFEFLDTGAYTFKTYLNCGTTYPNAIGEITDYRILAGTVTSRIWGFKLSNAAPINSIKTINTPSNLSLDVRVSNAHANDYNILDANAVTITDNANWYQYFAIDLGKRYDIDLIRNYGSPATDKLFINADTYVTYSNSDVSNIEDVEWDAGAISSDLLLHFDGENDSIFFVDAYNNHTITAMGDVSINTTNKKFGVGSAYFRDDSYLDISYTDIFNIGSDKFTIDFWLRHTSVGSTYSLFTSQSDFTLWIGMGYVGGDPSRGSIRCRASSNGTSWNLFDKDGNIEIVENIWYHIAFVRNGNIWTLYIDGKVAMTTNVSGSVINKIENKKLGVHRYVYIDEFRFTKGVARWTSEFTPPTSAYSLNQVTKTDARWVRINMIMGDNIKRYIRKLGIYPNTSTVYSLSGYGYNCEWVPFGNILTEYSTPKNIAYNADVSKTNYYVYNSYPTYAVDGVTDPYGYENAWGFQKVGSTNPYLELDFGAVYTIGRVKLYHGLENTSAVTKAFTIAVSSTVSGSFTTIKSVSGNSASFNDYTLTPVQARRLRLTITDYTGERIFIDNPDTGEQIYFNGSFLREIEVYTYTDTGYVDSENWPVVCVNLYDQFTVLNHALEDKDPLATTTGWDNDDSFFKYSDSSFNDPHKVGYGSSNTDITIYYSSDSSGNRQGFWEYEFGDNVYIEEGVYNVTCQIYDADSLDESSLRLEGPEIIDVFPTSIASDTWQDVNALITIKIGGFYTIKGRQHKDDMTYSWGVRYPHIYRTYAFVRWVAITRDSATNHVHDNNPSNYGIDYLSTVKIFGDRKYIPTEYYWWWTSTISTLTNDYLKVKEASRSLKIAYPDSSDIDIVIPKGGDDFGYDKYWSIKDALTFWLWIDDIAKFDTTFGDVSFGNIDDAAPTYYTWNLNNLSLNTGWNKILLKFEDADFIYPMVEDYYATTFYDKSLDYRLNEKDIKSFKLRYKGLGEAFNLYLTDIKIERNRFLDDVRFGKGLCLTGHDYLEIPLEGLTLERGTIEFWTKPYYDSYGRDVFDNWYSRTLFSLVNNNNNIVALSIRSGAWFEIAGGHVRRNLDLYNESNGSVILHNFIDINELFHVAVVWSNDGSFTDNGDTLRFYINGVLLYASREPWVIDDTKYLFIKLGGGSTQLAGNQDFFGGGVFDNIKLYDYCKSSFNINTEGVENEIVYEPNKFLEISKDDVNFYNINSTELPLIFEQVPTGESRSVYVRSIKDLNFKNSRKTANLMVSWLTTV